MTSEQENLSNLIIYRLLFSQYAEVLQILNLANNSQTDPLIFSQLLLEWNDCAALLTVNEISVTSVTCTTFYMQTM